MGYQGQNSRDLVGRRYGPPLSMVYWGNYGHEQMPDVR